MDDRSRRDSFGGSPSVINNVLPAVQHGLEIGKGGVAQGGQVDMREKEGTEYACQQPMNLD